MPYIVTTTRAPEHDGATGYVLSRRAVATVDEAMQAAQDVLDAGPPVTDRREWSALCDAIIEIPEQGGTIGPLPDGTTISVERVPGEGMSGLIDHLTRSQAFALTTRADLLAAECEIVSERGINWRGRAAELGNYGRSGGSSGDRRQIVEAMAALEEALR